MIKTMTRLEELILFILDRAHKMGIENLSRFQIQKIIYMIQVFAIKYAGKEFIPNITFIREENGPISPDIYESTQKLVEQDKFVALDISKKEDYQFSRYGHKLKKQLPKLSFSLSETIFLDNFISDLLPLSQKKLKEITYSTEPMKEIINREKGKINKGAKVNLSLIPIDPDVVDFYSDKR